MKKGFCIFTFVALVACFVVFELLGGETLVGAKAVEHVKSSAPAFVLYQPNTNTFLEEKNADKRLPIASITKLMTIKLALDAIDRGEIALSDFVDVSENAAAQTGSQAFLDEGEKYTIEDLLKSAIIASANDSAMALAEAVKGSEREFVYAMNKEAESLGMINTHFENPTGLPAAGHFSTAKDVAILAKNVLFHPTYKRFSKVTLDELIHPSGRKTQLASTSKKFRNFGGFEGGKTGHTSEAGYCFAAAAKRGDMNLVAVVLGANTSEERFETTKDLFEFGFSGFKTIEVLSKNKPIQHLPLKYSTKESMQVFPKESFCVFAPKDQKTEFETKCNITKTKVPICEGEVVGFVQVLEEGKVVFETELVTKEEYEHMGYQKILKDLAKNF